MKGDKPVSFTYLAQIHPIIAALLMFETKPYDKKRDIPMVERFFFVNFALKKFRTFAMVFTEDTSDASAESEIVSTTGAG